jgi:hypothetical protein
MEGEVERPVSRTLFRQASHETRLSPTVPSDPEDCECEHDFREHSLPRVVNVLVKKDSEAKTREQSVAVEPEEATVDGGTSQDGDKNESSASKHETGKADTIGEHGVNHGHTQEMDRPVTFYENDFQDEMDVSVVGQKTERPITTRTVETEIFKQDDETHDLQKETVGTLKGKEIYVNKVQSINH